MRILHFADGYLPHIGGTETLISNLCREQSASGHVVAVTAGALPGCGTEDLIDDVPVLRRRGRDLDLVKDPGLLMRFVEDAIAIKRRWCPDIVHVHGTALSAWINLLAGRSPLRAHATVVTLHGRLLLPIKVQERLIAEADCVTAVSVSLKDEFRELAAMRCEPICVLYSGVAAPALAPSPLKFEPATALCYGRLVDDKGFDVALRAFAEIPGLKIILAGDGVARPNLERLAAQLGLSGRIEFRGLVEPKAIPSLINEATLIVMPSRFKEPFGLVAVETALMGRPIVASRIGGIPEIVDDGQTGFLVPFEEPAAFAAAVRMLIDDPDMAAQMGALARERAAARFSIARCAAEFEGIYARVSHGPR